MQNTNALEWMTRAGALIADSHIVYTSGKHGSAYVNKDAIYPHTQLTSRLCRLIADRFAGSGVDVVAAPVIGGVILSQWVAYHLSELTHREILAVYAEKATEGFVLKRGYDKLIQGRRVLIVEDILNTGGSVRKVVECVRSAGGDIIGVAALCNRGKITTKELGDVPELYSLTDVDLQAWDEGDCPLCKQAVPINLQVGKGREYLRKLKA